MKRFFFIFIISLIIAKIFIVKASADLNEGLVAYYPFNGNATDESETGMDGTVFGATLTEDRFGNPNSAYHFDGIDDYINTNSTVGDNATALSVILWAYIENVDGWFTGIITRDREYVNYDDVWSILLIENQFQYEINETSGLEYMIRQNTTTGWHHLGLVYDGSEKRLETYLDGELVESKDTESGTLRSNPELKLSIGAYSGSSLPFSGKIDDVRIYNRVLYENEIQQLYNGPLNITIPEYATEGDGILEDQGIVSVFSAPDTDLVINLSSDDTSLVTVPETVTIHADQNTASFDITVIDNCINNDSQNVTITASTSCYISGLDNIQVADNDVSVEIDLPSGWSMVSLPVKPCNASVSSLFPEAKTVYGYEKSKGYVQVPENQEVVVGKGYWILLDQNQSYTLSGQSVLSYKKTLEDKWGISPYLVEVLTDGNNIEVNCDYLQGAGDRWDMIGGCTYPATASTDGCNIGVIYDYVRGVGYKRITGSEKIEPGKGYWILFRDFTCQLVHIPPSMTEDWPGEHFGVIVEALNYPVVMSELEQRLEEVITFIRKDENKEFSEISTDQSKIILYHELTPEQQAAYRNFANNTKTDIAQARDIDKNDNELLFPEERRHLYNSPYLEEINPTILQFLYGNNCPFDYTEYRITQGDRNIIISSSMIIKTNKLVTLDEGLYFFESLTLEKDSILNTNGDVQIYVKNLELKENARLMGGTSTDHSHASPNDLIILAQYWYGTPYSLEEDGVIIGPAAKIAGHIFAPNLKVRLSRGTKGRETRIYGSILTHQLVTYVEPGRQAEYGPIQIIYQEYLDKYTVNLDCDLEVKVSN